MRRLRVWLVIGSAPLGAAAQEAVELPPLVVEAPARDARPLLETTGAVSVVDQDELDRRIPTTFEDLFEAVPGVVIEGGPRGIAQEPNIRGFQDEQVVLRLDGGRFNFNQAHRGRFFVDPEIVERIEVVRGGGSTLYGSGALGGVIAVDTKDAFDLLDPDERFGARLRAGYATQGETTLASGTIYGAAGAFDGLAFLGWRGNGEDLEDGDDDPIRFSELDVVNGLAKLGFEPSPAHRFEISAAAYRDNGATPPNANAEASLDEVVDRDAAVNTFRGQWIWAPPGSELLDLSVLAYADDLTIEEDRDADGRRDETDYTTFGFEAVNRSRFVLGAPLTFVYGVEAFRDAQSAERDGAARAQFPDAEATTFAVFAEATVEITDRLSLVPGLRVDRYARDPDAADLDEVEETFVSPRIGLSFRPVEPLQLYANAARAFRAPSLTELYADGVHFAVAGSQLEPGVTFSGVNSFVPNPDLEPEKSWQYEIGARYVRDGVLRPGDRLRLGAAAYYADVEDFIDQRVTFIDFGTATPGPGGVIVGGTTASENVDAELWGLELEADYDARRWFAGLAVSLPRGEGEGGEPLGSIPQDRLTAILGVRPTPTVELGGRATFAAEQDDVPEGAEPGDGYAVLDLFAAWIPTRGPLAGAELRAGVDNLFDADYRIHPNGLEQPGRSFKVSAAFRF